MLFSLNEIETTAKLATRGAGFAWGIADEAGKSVRWLAAAGLQGSNILAGLLRQNDQVPFTDLAPMIPPGGVWQARSGTMCPLICGSALCDRAELLKDGAKISLGSIAYPLLLVPYCAAAAKLIDRPIELRWAAVRVVVVEYGFALYYGGDGARSVTPNENTAESDLTTKYAVSAACRVCDYPDNIEHLSTMSAEIDTETWSCFQELLVRTMAPATEASRQLGAGAGVTDND